ncbi:MAG TPA: DUF1254 domain-containing protein [Luteibacter sp.]|jgi:hypothetical protein|nr:DUF1254 domain-containing protein [Luteibacter sp.]
MMALTRLLLGGLPVVTAMAITGCNDSGRDREAAPSPRAAGTTSPVPDPHARTREIAKEAYIYAAPMIENYETFYKQVIETKAPEYVGGFGRVRNYAEPFTPKNHDVVTPNNDTPYSWAWLDLRAEPWVFSVPKVEKGRYYVAQWFDLFTYNFAYVGVRATGFDAGNYLFVGPGWRGEQPPGIAATFHAETTIVGMLGRTALDGPGDVANVKKIQAGYKLQPLSAFLHQAAPPPASSLDFPPYDKPRAESHDFIAYLNFLLQFAMPPHPSETALRERFASIGIVPGAAWDSTKVDPATLAAIDAGVADAKAELEKKLATTLSSNGLFGSRESLKNDYLTRAVAAAKGMYGNSLEEAWYGGYVGDGSVPSVVHFTKADLPQAKFFWSMTLYTLPDRFLYDNAGNRYSIGDRTRGLGYESDGSLTIHVSHASPGKDKESNWLPAPAGKYSLVARVYGPGPSLIDGSWKLPPLEPAK